MSYVTLGTNDLAALQQALSANGLEGKTLESKGAAEIQMVLIALGGGAGIAAMVAALGTAIRKFFEGKALVERSRTLTINVAGTTIKLTGSDWDQTLERALTAISTSSK